MPVLPGQKFYSIIALSDNNIVFRENSLFFHCKRLSNIAIGINVSVRFGSDQWNFPELTGTNDLFSTFIASYLGQKYNFHHQAQVNSVVQIQKGRKRSGYYLVVINISETTSQTSHCEHNNDLGMLKWVFVSILMY